MPPYETERCGDCAGSGIDLGSLHVPEECPTCGGSGYLLTPDAIESIARKHGERAQSIEPPLKPGYFEERAFRRTG